MSSSTSGSRFSDFGAECRHIFKIAISRRPHVAARTVASHVFATKFWNENGGIKKNETRSKNDHNRVCLLVYNEGTCFNIWRLIERNKNKGNQVEKDFKPWELRAYIPSDFADASDERTELIKIAKQTCTVR